MRAELERLNQIWTKAWLDRDAALVEKLMAPTYFYVAPNGQIFDRPTILGIIRSPEYRPVRGARTEVSVTPLHAEAVAVVSRWQGEGSYQDIPFQDDHRCTSIFVQLDNRWLMALEHCSAIGLAS